MNSLTELGITREDILDKAAEKLLEEISEDWDIAPEIQRHVCGVLVDSAKGKIDGLLQEALDDLLDIDFTPVDEWGEPIRKSPTTLRQMVKDKALNFLSEKVNKDGKACNYQPVGSRGEWLAEKAAAKAMDYEVKEELKKAVLSAKGHLQKKVAKYIMETLLK